MVLFQILSFSSLYQNGDIETINDTNEFPETLVQQIIESLLCYSASCNSLKLGTHNLGESFNYSSTRFMSYSPPFRFYILSNNIKWIVIFIDIAQVFPLDQKVTGLT